MLQEVLEIVQFALNPEIEDRVATLDVTGCKTSSDMFFICK